MYQSAVIDNSSLVYLSHLHKNKSFFHYLRNLFHIIYFPAEVVEEYARGAEKEPHRKWILQRLNPERGFYRLCNTYDSIVKAIVETEKGFDKGEAEAYAQLKKVNAHLIISDDGPFTKALKKLDSGIKVYTTLHLFCWLELAGLITNWNDIIKEIHRLRHFESIELRKAYVEVVKQLGLNISKNAISKKCSLKKIL